MSDTVITNQIILVALDDLRDPDWNPRPFLDEAEMPSLVDYVAAGRQLPPIEVLMGPGQAGPWYVISGKRRCEAHRRAGKTHIEAIPRDVPLEEAKFMAIAANKDDKPFWLGEFIAVNNLKKGDYGEQKIFAGKLGWTEKRVSKAFNLTPLLNPTTRDLIFQSTRPRITPGNSLEDQIDQDTLDGPTWRLTEKVACRLIPLWDDKAPEGSQAKAEQAVRTIIDHQLTASQTDDLVTHILAGNDPAQFEPAAKVKKARSKSPKAHTPLPPEMADKVVELPVPGQQTHPAPHTSHQQPHSVHPAHLSPKGEVVSLPTPPAEEEPGWFDKWLVGIRYITELRKKVKQGEPLTNSEKMYAGLDKLYQGALRPVGKEFLKWAKQALKGIYHGLKKAVGKVFGKTVEVLLPWVIVAGLVWGLLAFFHFAVISPWHWIEHKIGSIFHHEDITPPAGISPPAPAPEPTVLATPVPTAVRSSRLDSSQLKTHNSKLIISNSPPAAAYQPAVSFQSAASPVDSSGILTTLYDPKLLELEIAAVPKNSIIKDYPMTPDEGMSPNKIGDIPADLAVSRMQDLTDADKYTMMIGGSKQIIKSVNTTNSTLTILFKSTDLFGLLGGGSGPLNVFWEDLKYIHTNEIDISSPNSGTRQPDIIYQCSLVVSGAKYPLTIQCASSDDLEHLVSTMEFFIRNSRLGRDTALAGMPYPTQGIKLNNDRVVEKLWANSPADKAGLKLGDVIWSLDKNTQDQQDRKTLVAALQALTPGPHILYIVNPADFAQAQSDFSFGRARWLNPKRRKVILTTL